MSPDGVALFGDGVRGGGGGGGGLLLGDGVNGGGGGGVHLEQAGAGAGHGLLLLGLCCLPGAWLPSTPPPGARCLARIAGWRPVWSDGLGGSLLILGPVFGAGVF